MKKYSILLILFFSFFGSFSFATYDRFPVITNLVKSQQPDSLGYNIVADFSAVIYKGILNGRIKLWDSPKKELQILPATLQSIEISSKTRFASVDNIFIHEFWDVGKTDVIVTVVGFQFIKKTPEKEDVVYGFVDYDDASITLKSTFAEPNADGFWYVTYDQILKQRNYQYDLVQFGVLKVKNLDESERYKRYAFENKEYKSNSEEVKYNKRVSYWIEENHRLKGDVKLEKGNLLLKTFQDFINSNSWIYYGLKGIPFSDTVKVSSAPHLRVSKAEVTEIWNMNGTYISFIPQSIIIYVNDTALRPISTDELSKWEMVVDFKGVEDFLKEKSFFYLINRINNQPIERYSSYKYEKALFNADWNAINKYVKEEF